MVKDSGQSGSESSFMIREPVDQLEDDNELASKDNNIGPKIPNGDIPEEDMNLDYHLLGKMGATTFTGVVLASTGYLCMEDVDGDEISAGDAMDHFLDSFLYSSPENALETVYEAHVNNPEISSYAVDAMSEAAVRAPDIL